jgi:hypothetical protein
LNPGDTDADRTVYHIYHEKDRYHKRIQSKIDLKYESPRSTVKRAARKAKKDTVIDTEAEPELQTGNEFTNCGGAFFLHIPYLAFHDPPKVLYAGENKHATPVVLIHGSAFWRRYKLQYGDSLAADVLDPRGVVTWRHNGGPGKELKADDTKLKGYKVRTWRLWGETGKAYVHQVNANRKAGSGPDPDAYPLKGNHAAQAGGVVYLNWEHPFSRHTRQYHFRYGDVDFHWKGTGTMKKPNLCGAFVRYNHLKLIARIPAKEKSDPSSLEVCLGKYACSISGKKCGRLELYDDVISQLVEDYLQPVDTPQDERNETLSPKVTWLYRIVVATAMCMVDAEKEKRQAVGEWLQHAGEGGG